MSRIEYRILKAKDTLELERIVEIHLNTGWELNGGLMVIDHGDTKKYAREVTRIVAEEEKPARVGKAK